MHQHTAIMAAAGLGINWSTILAWIEQYGFPLVIQVLTALLQGGVAGLTIQQIIAWVVMALAAIAGGQPMPPLPAPAKP